MANDMTNAMAHKAHSNILVWYAIPMQYYNLWDSMANDMANAMAHKDTL